MGNSSDIRKIREERRGLELELENLKKLFQEKAKPLRKKLRELRKRCKHPATTDCKPNDGMVCPDCGYTHPNHFMPFT